MTVSGEALWIRCTMSVTVFEPCTVAVGLFGLLKKTRPVSPRRRRADHGIDIEPHRRANSRFDDRQVVPLREPGAVLERRQRRHETARWRYERAHRVLQDFLGSGAEHD